MSLQKKEVVIRFPSTKEYLKRYREKIESFRQEYEKKRTPVEKLADLITNLSGSFPFFTFHIFFFAGWIIVNTEELGFKPFDPYPYGFLTMVVSLEAIFLAVIVLLSQNRQAKIADLREELDLQINRIAEKEITKLIQMQVILMKHLGIRIEGDEELEKMMKDVDHIYIKRQLEGEDKKNSTTILPLISPQNKKGIGQVLKRISKLFDKQDKHSV